MTNTLDLKHTLRMAIIAVFVIFIIIYGLFRTKDLVSGVKIKNVSLAYESVENDGIVKISGNAKNANVLTLNDRTISMEEDGTFNETVSLFMGYNIVSIKANDEFGNSDKKDYKIMRSE